MTRDWALLLMGALTAILFALVAPVYAGETVVPKAERRPILPYVDEACAVSFACQDKVVWELMFEGSVVSLGDLTQEECEALRSEIEPQTPAFSALICRPKLVEREES